MFKKYIYKFKNNFKILFNPQFFRYKPDNIPKKDLLELLHNSKILEGD